MPNFTLPSYLLFNRGAVEDPTTKQPRRSLSALLVLLTSLALSCGDNTTTVDPDANLQFSEWGTPVNLGTVINTPTTVEQAPAISPDGLELYFMSDRGGGGGNDIWVSHRASRTAAWQTPANVTTLNTTWADSNPAFTTDGLTLYFVSDRPGGFGQNDIWVSHRTNVNTDVWQTPTNLGSAVNSAQEEAAPYILELAGSTTLYFSRGVNLTSQDLYSSRVTNGTFEPATLLSILNSPESDAHPTVRRDGKEIFFYSNRAGGVGANDLWTSTRASVTAEWSIPVNLTVLNTTSGELHPALDRDGLTLYFVSNRPGAGGSQDLYMATRTQR